VSDPTVVPATVGDRRRVLDTVDAAFRGDPAFRFFFPDEASYPSLVDRFVGHLYDKRVATGSAWVVDGGSAVALWDPPAGHAARSAVGPGAASAMALPADVQSRIDLWDSVVHELLPTEPHWYLGVLATHPAFAGRGWGRAVMRVGLDMAVREGVPACLETATQANVDLYRRCGWDVVGTAEVGGVTARVMLHRGRPAP
jgi:ribosomal protein S18 acetylase RimI-like enzyme